MQALNRHGQILQLGHQLRHIGLRILIVAIASRVERIAAGAELKVQLGQSLLLFANVGHLVHRAAGTWPIGTNGMTICFKIIDNLNAYRMPSACRNESPPADRAGRVPFFARRAPLRQKSDASVDAVRM